MNSPVGARRMKTDLLTDTMKFTTNRSLPIPTSSSSSLSPSHIMTISQSPPSSLIKSSYLTSTTTTAGSRTTNTTTGSLNSGRSGGGNLTNRNDLKIRSTTSSTPTTTKDYSNRSQLPARATRLLNRSRIQTHCGSSSGGVGGSGGGSSGGLSSIGGSNLGSDSPRSLDSFSNRKTSPRPSSQQQHHHQQQHQHQPLHHHHQQQHQQLNRDSINSSDDNIFMLDKSLRNAMIQDVHYFKMDLLRVRSILQENQPEDEEYLKRIDTLNPFEMNNGQFFGSGGGGVGTNGGGYTNFENDITDNKDLFDTTIISHQEETKQELADLRRQVVYLQSQLDDRDRTIRIQKGLIDKLETDMEKTSSSVIGTDTPISIEQIDTVNAATQTERTRPLSIGMDGSTSSKELDVDDDSTTIITSSPILPTTTPRKIIQPNSNLINKKKLINGNNKFTIKTIEPQKNNYKSSIMSNNNNNPSTSTPQITKLIPKSQSTTPIKYPKNELATIPNNSGGNGKQLFTVTPSPSPRRIPRLVKQIHVNSSGGSGFGGDTNNFGGNTVNNSLHNSSSIGSTNSTKSSNDFMVIPTKNNNINNNNHLHSNNQFNSNENLNNICNNKNIHQHLNNNNHQQQQQQQQDQDQDILNLENQYSSLLLVPQNHQNHQHHQQQHQIETDTTQIDSNIKSLRKKSSSCLIENSQALNHKSINNTNNNNNTNSNNNNINNNVNKMDATEVTVKLKNNLNVLMSPKFRIPVNSDDDF